MSAIVHTQAGVSCLLGDKTISLYRREPKSIVFDVVLVSPGCGVGIDGTVEVNTTIRYEGHRIATEVA